MQYVVHSRYQLCVNVFCTVQVFHPHTKRGVGELDFLDGLGENPQLTEEMVEKWWCLGDTRNRTAMWVQGRKVTDQH